MAHALAQRIHGRGELLADGLVHGIGLAAALFGGGFVLARAQTGAAGQVAVFGLYVLALVTMLGISAAYNLMPVSPLKWLLRRFDHSAIYVMIAATYTPLLLRLHEAWLAMLLAAVLWIGAGLGVYVKLALPGRHGRLAVATYLVLGWTGILAAHSFWQALPGVTSGLVVAGGLLYSAGVPFYLWDGLRYQRAIWHGFVVAAAACHFIGIAWLYL